MALRSTYDTGEYGSGLYGEPETTQFSATVALSVSSSASAVTIVDASASAAIAASSSASGGLIKDVSATVNILGVVTAAAVEYDSVAGFRDGYGINTYGTFMYGQNESIEEVTATANITITPSLTIEVTRNVSGSAALTYTTSAHAVYSIVGAASPTVSISPDISYNRVRLFSASDDILGDTTVSARYKWLPATDPTTTWTTAHYLERAA